jgi:glycosyltransferase involved in cell wall biosynthesis
MRLPAPRRSRLHFIGRVERFQELVRSYDLVIHPSREESFGLAMVEILAAGVPLLSSRAGVIEQIQENPALLFAPQNPRDQAEKIRHLWRHWAEVDFGLEACQRSIRRRFLTETIADRLAVELHQLMAEA